MARDRGKTRWGGEKPRAASDEARRIPRRSPRLQSAKRRQFHGVDDANAAGNAQPEAQQRAEVPGQYGQATKQGAPRVSAAGLPEKSEKGDAGCRPNGG